MLSLQQYCLTTFSSQTPVTSGVPQGCVLGPLLFLIYINDIENFIVSKISEFADDTKLCHSSRHPDGVRLTVNSLVDWANTWQMNFNIDKCAVMHIGHNNIQHNYTMEIQELIATDEQRYLGITITRYLKWQKQTEKSCKTANRVLGFIICKFNYKRAELMLGLYKSLVRPHLEYTVQFWSPHLCRDIDKMERVQRRATQLPIATIATNNGFRT